ncbi:MAG: recombinase family protein [Ktedonobacterales bacterium]
MTSNFEGQPCGIYPRVSTQRQSKKDRTSLDDQVQACRDYAAEHGMVVEEACVKKEAYTSTVMDRPELNELLKEMKARHVPNLIIDRTDRMTRQGQAVALAFLEQFNKAGITLHIVSMGEDGLVVRKRNHETLKRYLDAAYQAQLDNLSRARITLRARKSHARNGRYMRGASAPYGYRYVACAWDEEGNVTDKKVIPDERTFAELGYSTDFAETPFAARKEIIRLFAEEGLSCDRIAARMNVGGVPTQAQFRHRTDTRRTWYAATLRYIIDDQINLGKLTNFRTAYEDEPRDPDANHEDEWFARKHIPLDKQVVVTPPHGSPAPIVDERMASLLAARRDLAHRVQRPKPYTYSYNTLLGGGLAKCSQCGGTLRVHSVKYQPKYEPAKRYLYYECHMHEITPKECSGLVLSVKDVDPFAWNYVVGKMASTFIPTEGKSYLDVLDDLNAERSAKEKDTGTNPLDHWRTVRADQQNRAETLVKELSQPETADYLRVMIRSELTKIGQVIDEASRKIAAIEQQASRKKQQEDLLRDFAQNYYYVYSDLIDVLDPSCEEDIPIMAAILHAVGAKITLYPDTLKAKPTGEEPNLDVELTLTPMATQLVYTREQMIQLRDERNERFRAKQQAEYQARQEASGLDPEAYAAHTLQVFRAHLIKPGALDNQAKPVVHKDDEPAQDSAKHRLQATSDSSPPLATQEVIDVLADGHHP